MWREAWESTGCVGSEAPGHLGWALDGGGCLKLDFQTNGVKAQATSPFALRWAQWQPVPVDHPLFLAE